MSFQFDPNGEGFQKVLKDYQVETLKLVWSKAEEGVISREAWQHVNEAFKGEKTVSQARRQRLQEVYREDCDREPLAGLP
jgi:hypothetical protein